MPLPPPNWLRSVNPPPPPSQTPQPPPLRPATGRPSHPPRPIAFVPSTPRPRPPRPPTRPPFAPQLAAHRPNHWQTRLLRRLKMMTLISWEDMLEVNVGIGGLGNVGAGT